jgi:predicted  nucleic acid-binding Zn-ribbon protein
MQKEERTMELVTTCLNCGNRYRWDDKVSKTGMPDCPACGFNNQTGKKGSEKTSEYPEGLAGALLHLDSRGDDAVEELLTLASKSDRKSLAIVEEALVFLAGKKLNYFTPGPRVQTGAEVYGSKSYTILLKSLTNKARKKYLLDNAAETQDEIIRITGHSEYNAGSFFDNIREAGGQEALKIVQLLDTHVKVQARLIHMGVLKRRESIQETPRGLKMNSNSTTERILEDAKINVKIKLSALWVVFMMFYIYANIVLPGLLMGSFLVTQRSLLTESILTAIPAVMIFLSLALKPKVNRLVNISVGILYVLVGIDNLIGEIWVYYIPYGVTEMVSILLIVFYSWKWPKHENTP